MGKMIQLTTSDDHRLEAYRAESIRVKPLQEYVQEALGTVSPTAS